MKLVHLADLHLGYRAYHRTNPQGINIREADVARAFREVLDRTVELAPDLVLVAGDVFHSARPSNAAIADAFRQFSLFVSRCPETRVVIIAGNHDSPRAAETGNILKLYNEIPGVRVVHQTARRLVFPELDTALLCLPHNELLGASGIAIEPEPGAAHNILVAHTLLDDQRLRLRMGFGAAALPADAIDLDEWSYVALGHYHIRSRLAPNMFYSGAIERTSPNIWAEADDAPPPEREDTWKEAAWGKGFVEFDLADGSAIFHALGSPRPVLDLPPVRGQGLTVAELDDAIESSLTDVDGGIDGKIVRLRVFDVERSAHRELDHARLRQYRTRALHLHVDVRPPQVVRHTSAAAPGRRLTLQEELVSFLTHRWRTELKRIDRGALIELGTRYLQQAEDVEALRGAE